MQIIGEPTPGGAPPGGCNVMELDGIHLVAHAGATAIQEMCEAILDACHSRGELSLEALLAFNQAVHVIGLSWVAQKAAELGAAGEFRVKLGEE